MSNTPWINYESNIYNNKNKIGFGTNNPIEKLHLIGNFLINADIIPSINTNFNLGSSNNKWKDLYLSGNSIYLDTLILSKNNCNNLEIRDINNNLTSISVKDLEFVNGNDKLKFGLSNGQLIYNSNGILIQNNNFNTNNINNLNVQCSYQLNNCNIPFSLMKYTNVTTINGVFTYNSTSNDYGYFSFVNNGSIFFPQTTVCDVLVVGAGGNDGTSGLSGGGGGGSSFLNTSTLILLIFRFQVIL